MPGWYNPTMTLKWVVDDGQAGGHYDYLLQTSIINFPVDWRVTCTPLYNDLVARQTFVAARARLTVDNVGYATPKSELYPYSSAPRATISGTIGKIDLTTLAAFKAWGDSLFTTVFNLATPPAGLT